MLELARLRLGADADLRVADLASPLPFPDCSFDDVVASLVLHCLKDWGPTLAELRRVLTAEGRLIVSVDHPFAIYLTQRLAGGKTSYFETRNRVSNCAMSTYASTFELDLLIAPVPGWVLRLAATTSSQAQMSPRTHILIPPLSDR